MLMLKILNVYTKKKSQRLDCKQIVFVNLQIMKAEIQRIRKSNFSDIQRRVGENNAMLDLLSQQISTEKPLLKYETKIQISKLNEVKENIMDLKNQMNDIGKQLVRTSSFVSELCKVLANKLIDQIKKKDQTITQLNKQIIRLTNKPELIKHSRNQVLNTENTTHIDHKHYQSTRFITHTGTSLEKTCPIRKNGSFGSFTHSQNDLTGYSSTVLNNYFTNQSQQFIRNECKKERIQTERKSSLQIDTGTIITGLANFKSSNKKDIIDTQTKIVDKEAIIIGHCMSQKQTASFFSSHNSLKKSRYVAPSVCVSNEKPTNISIKAPNKQNGPVLPKPLRKRSTQSQRNTSSQKPPQIPSLKMPIFAKAPTQNGFGVLLSNGNEIYRGVWKNGMFDGRGKLKGNGWVYEGEFKNGHAEGAGIIVFGKEYKWIGKCVKDMPEGEGCLIYSGNTMTGIWKKGQLERRTNGTNMFA